MFRKVSSNRFPAPSRDSTADNESNDGPSSLFVSTTTKVTKDNPKQTTVESEYKCAIKMEYCEEKSQSSSNSASGSNSGGKPKMSIEDHLEWLTRCIFALEMQTQSLQAQLNSFMTSKGQQYQNVISRRKQQSQSRVSTGRCCGGTGIENRSQSGIGSRIGSGIGSGTGSGIGSGIDSGYGSQIEQSHKCCNVSRRKNRGNQKAYQVIKIPRHIMGNDTLQIDPKIAESWHGCVMPVLRNGRVLDHDVLLKYTQTKTKRYRAKSRPNKTAIKSKGGSLLLPTPTKSECNHLGQTASYARAKSLRPKPSSVRSLRKQ